MKTIIRNIINNMYRMFVFKKKKIREEDFLPGETIRRAADLIRQKDVSIPPIDAEPDPLGALGMAIGLLRRRKNITHSQFAQSIGCSVEELLALETGLLPAADYKKYLPLIRQEVNIPEAILQLFTHGAKSA